MSNIYLNYIQIAPISEKNHFGRKYHTLLILA